MKLTSKIVLCALVSVLISACGTPLSQEKKAEAESLIVTNVICEVLGNYRISTMRLNLMPPQQHKDLAYSIYDGAGINSFSLVGGGEAAEKGLDDFRAMLDVAFKEDIQKLTGRLSYDREKLNRFAEKFYGLFQSKLDEHYGYTYPDCEMAFSMSEAFLAQNL